jgi:hypothetical protein
MLKDLGHFPESLESYKRCLEIQLVIIGKDHSEMRLAYNNIG